MQEGLILSGCIKVINLITSLPFAQSRNKKEKKNINEILKTYLHRQRQKAYLQILDFCCEGSKWVDIRAAENHDKVRPQKEKI